MKKLTLLSLFFGFAVAAVAAPTNTPAWLSRPLSLADALNTTRQMYEITAAENNVYQIPALDFRGSPTGIDVVKVLEKGIFPVIDTGVAHREPGVGQVGAGILSAPPEPFQKAIIGLAHSLKLEVIAEGIEHQDQLDCLLGLGCENGQGFYFSAPLSPQDAQAAFLLAGPGVPRGKRRGRKAGSGSANF